MSSLEGTEQLLLEVRQKVYPRAVTGRFATWRRVFVWGTQLLYYGLPWLSWNDRQAVLFDLAARRFHVLGLVFYPQDFIYLTGLLVVSALSLFLFTTVAGRLWCGYACPQTVYTEIFLWIERVVEGERGRRMKLDKAPMSARKLRLKASKHALWIALSLWTGFTFVGYFTPIRELTGLVASLSLGPWQTFWILFYGFATYGNAGFLREQVCKYMCPYARFQGVMVDRDTLVITYDPGRGEPRGAKSRKSVAEGGRGDCVDCGICVQVCPTGIDIRDGQQYECIGCAACIDACDQVMDKVGTPRGLIRYDTLNRMEAGPAAPELSDPPGPPGPSGSPHAVPSASGRRASPPAGTRATLVAMLARILRPRVLLYSSILLTVTTLLFGHMLSRTPLKVDVMRDRGALAREVKNGWIENVYRLQIINTAERARTFTIDARGLDGLALAGTTSVALEATDHRLVAVPVRVPPGAGARGSNPIEFVVEASDDPTVRHVEPATFFVPESP